MSFFVLLNTKEYILKNVGNQKVSGPFRFCHTMKVNGDQQQLTIFFKISSKNSLEQLDGE